MRAEDLQRIDRPFAEENFQIDRLLFAKGHAQKPVMHLGIINSNKLSSRPKFL